MFLCKRKKRTTLPQATTPLSGGNGPFERAPRNSCPLQELRGHETERKFRLRQGGRNQIFFTKCWLFEPTFREKDKSSTMLPQANLASIWLTAWFEQPPRKSCKGVIFFRNMLRKAQHVSEKDRTLPRCRRRSRRSGLAQGRNKPQCVIRAHNVYGTLNAIHTVTNNRCGPA
jgi:hypothetical protein